MQVACFIWQLCEEDGMKMFRPDGDQLERSVTLDRLIYITSYPCTEVCRPSKPILVNELFLAADAMAQY